MSNSNPTTNTSIPENQSSSTPPLPSVDHVRQSHAISPSPPNVAARLLTLAESYLFLNDGLTHPSSWENDLCSATFWATYALCMDTSSIRARRILARCARLGGYNVLLPFAPSGTATSSLTTSTRLNSADPNNRAGAQAAIHILQHGPSSTFTDVASAREYRDACYTLNRNSDALEVANVIAPSNALGKRKVDQAQQSDAHSATPPTLVTPEDRYESQLLTDLAFEAVGTHRQQEATSLFRDALSKDLWNWRAWTGLADMGSSLGASSVYTKQPLIDAYERLLDARTPPLSPASELVLSDPETMVASQLDPLLQDPSNKKAKLSDDDRAPSRASSTVTSSARKTTRTRAGSVAAGPASTDSNLADSTAPEATVPRVNVTKATRALSTARTNTAQNVIPSQNEKEEKAAIKGVTASRSTRSATTTSKSRANGMQLRSTSGRANPPVPVPSRAGATSQAGSVTSTSSSSNSRSTTTVARPGVATRRVPVTSSATTGVTNGSASRTAANGRATAQSATATRPTSTASSRLNTASSKGAAAASAALSAKARSTVVSSRRTPAAEMAARREAAERAKAELVARQRAAALESATELANWLATDLAILSLMQKFAESYRHIRNHDGERAVSILAPLGAPARQLRGALRSKVRETTPSLSEDGGLSSCARNTITFHCLLARGYNETAQYAQAEMHFEAVRKLNPYALAHMDIYSLVLFQLNREVALTGLAQELTLVDGSSATSQIVIGNAFALQRENQTALVCFQRAASMAPNYAYAYTLAGHEAHELGNHDEAIAYFRSAIRCDARHWNAWAGLGRVFVFMKGHELAASKSLERAISINSGNYVLWDLVGSTYSQLGRKRPALDAYNKAIALAPKLAVLTYLRRSELQVSERRYKEAHEDLERAHELAPEEGTIHILLAQSYMRLGGGGFCELEAGNGTVKASGEMRMPYRFQSEITHHLAVAVDLDPSMLKVVKAMGEGWRTSPGNRIVMNPAELSNSSAFEERYLDYSGMSADILEDVDEVDDEQVEEAMGLDDEESLARAEGH